MNAKAKYVVSTTLTDASAWRNSTIIKDNVIEQVRALKEQPGKNILIDGSSVLVHSLAQNDLIDEYSLLVYPLALGGGKKVFADGLRTNLRLVETRSFPTGVTYIRYAVERPDRRRMISVRQAARGSPERGAVAFPARLEGAIMVTTRLSLAVSCAFRGSGDHAGMHDCINLRNVPIAAFYRLSPFGESRRRLFLPLTRGYI